MSGERERESNSQCSTLFIISVCLFCFATVIPIPCVYSGRIKYYDQAKLVIASYGD